MASPMISSSRSAQDRIGVERGPAATDDVGQLGAGIEDVADAMVVGSSHSGMASLWM